MYISFDDGNSWSEFQLNLPVTSIRDLKVKDNDLVVTQSFWIIDDLTPLHQFIIKMRCDSFKPVEQSGGRNKIFYMVKTTLME